MSKPQKGGKSGYYFPLILFENQIQTASASPCRTKVQSAASFLVCSLIFIEYKILQVLHISITILSIS
ncbi:hypothetical protein B7692_03605 [Streptococcus mitis]|uniref:Uncharacterized protein n=1 Tax=Streptococcus mitis TaxID=28037 RepID=A0A1X1L806_STRMT|nr:hypothetical protein B7692_03605 [Streptococcus mitis]